MPRMSCPLAELGRVALQAAILEGKSDTWATITRGSGGPSWLTRRGFVGTSHLRVARMVHLCPLGGM